MSYLYSIFTDFLSATGFFVSVYFICWLFFSRRLKFLESKITSSSNLDTKFLDLQDRFNTLQIDFYLLEGQVRKFNKRQDEFEAKSDILNRISRLEGKIEK